MSKVDWTKWDVKEITFESTKGLCRNCDHGEYWHIHQGPSCTYNLNNECKAIMSGNMGHILIPRSNPTGLCPCLRFIPGNNLDYLEYMATHEEKK